MTAKIEFIELPLLYFRYVCIDFRSKPASIATCVNLSFSTKFLYYFSIHKKINRQGSLRHNFSRVICSNIRRKRWLARYCKSWLATTFIYIIISLSYKVLSSHSRILFSRHVILACIYDEAIELAGLFLLLYILIFIRF